MFNYEPYLPSDENSRPTEKQKKSDQIFELIDLSDTNTSTSFKVKRNNKKTTKRIEHLMTT